MDSKIPRSAGKSRPTSSKRDGSTPAPAPAAQTKTHKGASGHGDIFSREQEYMKMNAAIEAKTTQLANHAESIVRGQDEYLSRPITRGETSAPPETDSTNTRKSNVQSPWDTPRTRTLSVARSISPTPSSRTGHDDDSTASGGMGTEATLRFLKAKVKVMQEELDRTTAELQDKDDALLQAEAKVREVTEDRAKLIRTHQQLQINHDKHKKVADDARKTNIALETQISNLRKELDGLQKQQKTTFVDQSSLEVRMNRALEELDKSKQALQSSKQEAKENGDRLRKQVDSVSAENKRLERQKSELMSAFKKQLKLIDILKRQKV
eukprot:Opistho-2@52981